MPVSLPPPIARGTYRPIIPPGELGRINAGWAAPCPCCGAPMRLRSVDGEHRCSDDAKYSKSNKGSHGDLLGVGKCPSLTARVFCIRRRWHFQGGPLSGSRPATAPCVLFHDGYLTPARRPNARWRHGRDLCVFPSKARALLCCSGRKRSGSFTRYCSIASICHFNRK
jgi:hypothetical protein